MLSAAYRSLIAGVLIHLCLGTLYLWGNITVAVTSYIRQYEPSVTYSDSITVYALTLGFQGFFMLIGGLLEKTIGLKETILLGGSLLSTGVFASSFAKSLISLIFCYGFMFSAGMGMCYAPPIVCCVQHMPDKKGFVTGIVVAGFGAGAFVFGGLATYLSNPEGLNVDETGYFPPGSSVCQNVPTMFRVLGCTYAGLFILAILLIEEPTVSSNEEKSSVESIRTIQGSYIPTSLFDDGGKNDEMEDGDSKLSVLPEDDPFSLMSNSLAWQLSSCYVMTVVGGMYIAGTYKTYGQIYFVNRERFLSAVGSVASICNGLGRIIWGMISDAIGPINAVSLLAFMFSFVIWTFPLPAENGNEIAFALWTFLIFFFVGGNFALYLPITIQLFGNKHASPNYGVIVNVYCIFNALNIMFLSRTNLSLSMACSIMGFVCFLGFVNVNLLAMRIRQKRKC